MSNLGKIGRENGSWGLGFGIQVELLWVWIRFWLITFLNSDFEHPKSWSKTCWSVQHFSIRMNLSLFSALGMIAAIWTIGSSRDIVNGVLFTVFMRKLSNWSFRVTFSTNQPQFEMPNWMLNNSTVPWKFLIISILVSNQSKLNFFVSRICYRRW